MYENCVAVCESPMYDRYASKTCCEKNPDIKEEFVLLKQFAKVRVLQGKHINIQGDVVHEWRFIEVAHNLKDRLGNESVIWHQDHATNEVIDILLA